MEEKKVEVDLGGIRDFKNEGDLYGQQGVVPTLSGKLVECRYEIEVVAKVMRENCCDNDPKVLLPVEVLAGHDKKE